MTEMEGLVTFFTRFLEDKKTRKTLDWFPLSGDKLGPSLLLTLYVYITDTCLKVFEPTYGHMLVGV